MFEINLLPVTRKPLNFNKSIVIVGTISLVMICVVLKGYIFFFSYQKPEALNNTQALFSQVTLPTLIWKGCLKSQNNLLGLIQVAEKLVTIQKGSIIDGQWKVMRITRKGAWLMIAGKEEFVGDVI